MYTTIDIFTDASIDPNTKLACAGCLAVNRSTDTVLEYGLYLDPNSTNNRAEIMAIEQGIHLALNMLDRFRSMKENLAVNLISDSMFAVKGVSEWMLNWTTTDGDILYNSSGQEAANQSFFKNIFNMIVGSGMKIKFYHQKGHVTNTTHSIYESRYLFYKSNGITIETAGFTPEYLAKYNNQIDKMTRDLIKRYQLDPTVLSTIANANWYKEFPMDFFREESALAIYKQLINGGINYLCQ